MAVFVVEDKDPAARRRQVGGAAVEGIGLQHCAVIEGPVKGDDVDVQAARPPLRLNRCGANDSSQARRRAFLLRFV